MSWEGRGDRRYYYNKRRVGDRVISEYVGAGEFAEVCAALDALKREMRKLARTTPALQVNIAAHGGQQLNLLGGDPPNDDRD